MATDRLERQIGFAVEIGKVKQVLRRTITVHSDRNENDAEHSWHMAAMAAVLSEHAGEGLDILRVIKMAVVHDLVEIDAGDVYCYSAYDPEEKLKRETMAAERIFGMLPDDQAEELLALWREFEEGASPEAKFAVALDRLQPLLLNYHTGGRVWREHGVSKKQVLERSAPIGEASPDLWEYARRLIERAVSEGILPE